jgi:hypothetical protein
MEGYNITTRFVYVERVEVMIAPTDECADIRDPDNDVKIRVNLKGKEIRTDSFGKLDFIMNMHAYAIDAFRVELDCTKQQESEQHYYNTSYSSDDPQPIVDQVMDYFEQAFDYDLKTNDIVQVDTTTNCPGSDPWTTPTVQVTQILNKAAVYHCVKKFIQFHYIDELAEEEVDI